MTTVSDTVPTPGSTPETFVANLETGTGPGNVANLTAGLADLSSYTATLTVAFDGTDTGQPSKWSATRVLTATKDPAARQLTVTTTGDLPEPSTEFTAEVNGASYAKSGQDPCTADAVGADPEASPILDPAASLASVFGADAAGSETVNDTPADHYTFDERAILEKGRATSNGEVWLASAGGYIVRYALTSKAGADYFGDAIDGTISWDYELTAVNQPVAITLPDDCPSGIIDAPQLPDATNVDSLPGMLTYDTATPLADIVAFYQTELGTRGWVAADDPYIDEIDASVEFSRDAATLSLTATLTGTVASVQLLLA